MMSAGIRRSWFWIIVLGTMAPTASAHQIQNGSFESGINPPAPPTPPRVAADPGTVDLTETTDDDLVPPFLGPLGWPGLIGGPLANYFSSGGMPGGKSQPGIGRNIGQTGPRSNRSSRSGRRGGGGGGSGSGGGHPHHGSQPTPGTALLSQSEKSLYPNQDPTTSALTIPQDETDDEGTILEKDPVWVAELFAPSTTSFFQSLTPDETSDSELETDEPIHSNPAPAGVWLGLMAFGTFALRYRRSRI